jgi:hypothetical protein
MQRTGSFAIWLPSDLGINATDIAELKIGRKAWWEKVELWKS